VSCAAVIERMLETYLYARDKFLKPGGKMFPVSASSCGSWLVMLVMFSEVPQCSLYVSACDLA
jgi:hypothetical protein